MSSVQAPFVPTRTVGRTPPKKPPAVGYRGIEEPLSIAQYHELIEAGVLTTDDKVELLNGRLVPKMTQNHEHREAWMFLEDALRQLIPAMLAHVMTQAPITLATGEPEPDVCIIRGSLRQFARQHRHPLPRDLLLVAEVADSSLRFDRGEKLETYAAAGIEHYWIVNLIDRRVECYSQPDAATATYRSVRNYLIGEVLEWQTPELGTLRLKVADLLPESITTVTSTF